MKETTRSSLNLLYDILLLPLFGVYFIFKMIFDLIDSRPSRSDVPDHSGNPYRIDLWG